MSYYKKFSSLAAALALSTGCSESCDGPGVDFLGDKEVDVILKSFKAETDRIWGPNRTNIGDNEMLGTTNIGTLSFKSPDDCRLIRLSFYGDKRFGLNTENVTFQGVSLPKDIEGKFVWKGNLPVNGRLMDFSHTTFTYGPDSVAVEANRKDPIKFYIEPTFNEGCSFEKGRLTKELAAAATYPSEAGVLTDPLVDGRLVDGKNVFALFWLDIQNTENKAFDGSLLKLKPICVSFKFETSDNISILQEDLDLLVQKTPDWSDYIKIEGASTIDTDGSSVTYTYNLEEQEIHADSENPLVFQLQGHTSLGESHKGQTKIKVTVPEFCFSSSEEGAVVHYPYFKLKLLDHVQ